LEVPGSNLNEKPAIMTETSHGFPPDKCKDSKIYKSTPQVPSTSHHPLFLKMAPDKKETDMGGVIELETKLFLWRDK
jgi:hypothetical protein